MLLCLSFQDLLLVHMGSPTCPQLVLLIHGSIACHWVMLLILGFLTWTRELLLLVEMGFSGHHPTLCGLIIFIHICCQLVSFKFYS